MGHDLSNEQESNRQMPCDGAAETLRRRLDELDARYAESLSAEDDLVRQIGELQRSLATDAITGFMNRSTFMQQIDRYFSDAPEHRLPAALIKVDLDNFRIINDTFGNRAGDHVLQLVAGVISDICLRPENRSGEVFFGRIGADEFGIFFPASGLRHASGIAEQVRKRIEDCRFVYSGLRITASCGIVCMPQHATTTDDLIRKADAANYSAKLLGHNRCHVFAHDDDALERFHSQSEQKKLILNALEEDRFEIWLQPILKIADRTVHHYEVLIRMRTEDGRILLPGEFMNTAERFGLVAHIDRIAAAKAITLQSEMVRLGKDLYFSSNISGRNLDDEELFRFIRDEIHSAGIDPQRIIFEITETAAIRDFRRALHFVGQLKSIGCLFSLDDFGVGFTSFLYLRELPLDYLKIDGSFIRRLHEDAVNQVLVKAIVDIANVIGVKTIAECVELRETLPVLQRLGVHYAQGFLIGAPAMHLQRE